MNETDDTDVDTDTDKLGDQSKWFPSEGPIIIFVGLSSVGVLNVIFRDDGQQHTNQERP